MGGSADGEAAVVITLVVAPDVLMADEVEVEGAAYTHLFRSRRLGLDAEVRLVDGRGRARFSRVVEISSTDARFALAGEAPPNEPRKQVELFVPVPRSSRLDWLVEKVTEVGVSVIRLITTERAPRGLGSQRIERLRRVAVAAVEQSHRSVIPEISGVHELSEVARLLEETSERWVLHREGRDSGDADLGRAALLVGPEGGWTQDEVEWLDSHECRFVGLGPTVLRVETAAVVGCSGLLNPDAFR